MENKKENFFKKAFKDMAQSAKEQHEVDRANLAAAKAESKANFEENRGKNTLKRAKEGAKASWEEAKLSPAQKQEKRRAEQQGQIADANKRKGLAEKRIKKVQEERK